MPTQSAKVLCDFIDASPTPYHAVDSAAAMLKAAGALILDESAAWKLESGKTYLVCRDGAALVAFRMGRKAPSESGFVIAGAHTDSPALRARIEKNITARGMDRVAVEAYGGPIFSTWLDRPLSLAGRVVVKTNERRLEPRLVNFARPVAVIPNLAIHFNREMNKGFEYAANTTLLPLISASGTNKNQPETALLITLLAQELNAAPDAIVSADLSFVDAAPSLLLGNEAELISAPRIDNLEGCHAITTAFMSAQGSEHTQCLVLFDNEETGSGTMRGAASSFLRDILERVALSCDDGKEAVYQAAARSLSISVDGAQGWHPSYADKFDEAYAPLLNGGPAVKLNANNRYASDAFGEAVFMDVCKNAGIPCQRFRMRADLTPGSTIGPVSSSLLGIRTIDVGVPMLAMHSARETAGSLDHEYMINALKAFYGNGLSYKPDTLR